MVVMMSGLWMRWLLSVFFCVFLDENFLPFECVYFYYKSSQLLSILAYT